MVHKKVLFIEEQALVEESLELEVEWAQDLVEWVMGWAEFAGWEELQ